MKFLKNKKIISSTNSNFVNRVWAFLVSVLFLATIIFLVGNSSISDNFAPKSGDIEHLSALVTVSDITIFKAIVSKFKDTIDRIKTTFLSLFNRDLNGDHIIIITEGKFDPSEITISLGDTVVFRTNEDNSFWPASSLHPEHDIYPEFDPLVPIEPGETWSFTFERAGKWGFHDHLRPFLRGSITVLDEGEQFVELDCLKLVELGQYDAKSECWEFSLAKTVEEKTVKEAFMLLSSLYSSNPDFSETDCHWYSHKIGDASYAKYLTHKKFSKVEFPAESSYCGYGYYHGFFEHYLRDDPDFDKAVEICEELIETKSDILPRIRLNCFHAIGHGFIMEPSDTGIWGDAQAFLESGLNTCRKIKNSDERMECFQGGFNVISDWTYTEQYGLKADPNNPMDLCTKQENYEETLACYYEFSMKLSGYTENGILDFYNSYVKDIEDDNIANEIINPLMASVMQKTLHEEDQIPLIYECRSLPERVQIACMKGITGGFVAHGEPEKEYIKAIRFCSSSIMTSEEKNVCYWNIVRTFKGVYTEEFMKDVCPLIENEYQYYCYEDYEI